MASGVAAIPVQIPQPTIEFVRMSLALPQGGALKQSTTEATKQAWQVVAIHTNHKEYVPSIHQLNCDLATVEWTHASNILQENEHWQMASNEPHARFESLANFMACLCNTILNFLGLVVLTRHWNTTEPT